jgi:DUF1009 family protein
MPAASEIDVKSALPRKIALIAGGGSLPGLFLASCDAQGIEVFGVGFAGQTNEALFTDRPHLMTRLGAAGQILQVLREQAIGDLVFIGAIRRPGLAELRPDWRTTAFFLKIGFKALGDDGLLTAVRRELELEGFTLHGVQAFMTDALAAAGPVGRLEPDREALADIAYGSTLALALGRLDIGQSVIVQQGLVLGVEAAEGTDELIRRCAGYKREGRGAVLVKRAKPQQDRDLDLPTIGPETVRLCAEAGMAGIAVEAGGSLLLDRAEVAELADRHGLFVTVMDFAELCHDG